MRDNVLYFLGAGFSAPFGLPLTANFLERARELYFGNRGKYDDLKVILDAFQRYSVAKNYFSSDLFNIEEVFSLLQLEEDLGGGALEEEFVRFISRVIKAYTPPILPYGKGPLPGNWYEFIFGDENARLMNDLGFFVGNLLGLVFAESWTDSEVAHRERKLRISGYQAPGPNYAVISLNYDMLLENCARFLDDYYDMDLHHGFSFDIPDSGPPWRSNASPLAKLHGSVDSGAIVPPTWKKGVNEEIKKAWQCSFQLIAGANHIRVFGYSLAMADAYIKYLFKAAIVHSDHLKSFDVICWDPTGEVRRRFEEFVTFPRFTFVSVKTEDYLQGLCSRHKPQAGDISVRCNELEAHHDYFMRSHQG